MAAARVSNGGTSDGGDVLSADVFCFAMFEVEATVVVSFPLSEVVAIVCFPPTVSEETVDVTCFAGGGVETVVRTERGNGFEVVGVDKEVVTGFETIGFGGVGVTVTVGVTLVTGFVVVTGGIGATVRFEGAMFRINWFMVAGVGTVTVALESLDTVDVDIVGISCTVVVEAVVGGHLEELRVAVFNVLVGTETETDDCFVVNGLVPDAVGCFDESRFGTSEDS